MRFSGLISIAYLFLLLIKSHAAWGAAISSTSISPSAATPAAVILVDAGYFYAAPSDGGSSQHTFSTNTVCPATFNPYVTMDFNRIDMLTPDFNHQISIATGYGACVRWVVQVGSIYTVTYLSVMQFYYLFHDQHNGTWMSNTNLGFGTGNVTATPNLSELTTWTIPQYDVQSPRFIYWHLYCYPPTLSPPLDQSNGGSNTAVSGANCSPLSSPYL